MYFFHSFLNSVRPNNVFKRGRGRNKLGNLCPIPLIKYLIKYVLTNQPTINGNSLFKCTFTGGRKAPSHLIFLSSTFLFDLLRINIRISYHSDYWTLEMFILWTRRPRVLVSLIPPPETRVFIYNFF